VAEQTQKEQVEQLTRDVQSLTFDNERVIKPALKDIRDILSRDVYASKVEVAELKKQIEALEKALEKEKERTRNYLLVERVVFGLVGVILLAVVGALVGLVVIGRNSGGA
jgi:hypothetical protein